MNGYVLAILILEAVIAAVVILFAIKRKGELPMAKLIIFNHGTDLEFGECSECSAAIDPYGTLVSKGDKTNMRMACYPETCPYCHSEFLSRVIVEEE